MSSEPKRVVTDSMLGMQMPDVAVWSERVTVVLGQNPGIFTGPGTNTYLIGIGRRPLLLDTGQGVAAYFPLLERALTETRPSDGLQDVVVTHAHPDHIGGVNGVLSRYGPLRILKKPWPGRDPSIEITPIDDGDEIRTEGATLTAIWTPGHSRDHLCFYLKEEKGLFTGDVVLGAGTTVIPPDGDLIDYLASLRRLLEFDLEVIYPAHGPAIRNPRKKIESYIAHRLLREEQVLAGLRGGLRKTQDLVRRIYSDVPSFLHAAAGLSVDAHLRKLEKEGRARCQAGEWSIDCETE